VKVKTVLAGAAVVALGLTPAAQAAKPVKKTIKVRDNFFAPAKLTVPVNSTLVWKWPTVAGDVHDVFSASKPKGFKRFHSEAAASDYSFKRKLTKAGKYLVVCTLHEEMTMRVTVKK
jgi:plastocyanin